MIARLLTLANSGRYPEKWEAFYPFKDRFLRRHAQRDGEYYDKQVIQKPCYRCQGDGSYYSHCDTCRYEGSCSNCRYMRDDHEDFDEDCGIKMNRCPRCRGTGLWIDKTVWLERWVYGGRVFHIPVADATALPILMPDPVQVFDGYVKHATVDPRRAWRAAMTLFLIYEPRLFVRLAARSARLAWRAAVDRAEYWWWRVRRGDDIPF